MAATGGRYLPGYRPPPSAPPTSGQISAHASGGVAAGGMHRADGGGQHLRVRQQYRPVVGVKPHIGDAEIDHRALDRSRQRSGPDPYLVAHPEWPGELQHHPGEEVRQRLLRRDRDEDAGDRTADYELRHAEAEHGQRHEDYDAEADQDRHVPDDGHVGGPDESLEHIASPAG